MYIIMALFYFLGMVVGNVAHGMNTLAHKVNTKFTYKHSPS